MKSKLYLSLQKKEGDNEYSYFLTDDCDRKENNFEIVKSEKKDER